ncbi:hypothetical protein CPB83DRAFT_782908 [Crepidotus variabilis]|uniref:37S ribosomal protein mrp10, mitochondrial n=1 Tax=Crepidotus variabilis TaxID=179855 RepID=A0A9P6EQ92_9AGAR|nr:hypothetical protein CPB83DRAFT_782908 [Crepidotus variabilis]
MTIHIKKLKVRPKKAAQTTMCAPELTSMLACWAATGDTFNHNACQESAKNLFQCMRTAPMPKKIHKPTINFHLARLGKSIQ